jgi:hypothetical protein
MTDTRRYGLVWLAAAFLGLNAGFGALVVTLAVMGAWLHWEGTPRTVLLYASFLLPFIGMTLAVGKALVRRVSKELR